MIELLNIDCMEYMKSVPDKYFELAIVDPPYGISINMNMGRKAGKAKKHKDKSWDDEVPGIEYFEQLYRVSVNQVVWGANYFTMPPCKHFIVWDKLTPDDMSFSFGEYAWTSFDMANKKFTYRNVTGDKIHPTQKPVQLYKWILNRYAKEGDKILDTHLGSGSIAIACHDMGFDLVGCELDKDYYEAAVKRFNNHKMQQVLF